jgi:AraC-like DNA-binding protein
MRKTGQKIKYCPPPGDEKRSFLVDHVRIPPNEQITFHQHDALEISYIIVGSGTRIIGNTLEPFSQGEIVFIPSNVPHCWSFDDFDTAPDGTIENISIFFSPWMLENARTGFPELDDCISKIQQRRDAVVFTGNTLTKLQSLMKAMPSETEIEKLSSLFRMLSVISSAGQTNVVGSPVVEDRNTKRMQRAYSYVINNFQSSVSLDDVAKYVGMDRSSFCTFFKKMTGKSFFTFLTEYRLESSSQMLQKTSLSVAEICNAAGFNDVPHFNRVFKKTKQITPTQFRAGNLGAHTSRLS